MSKLHIAMLAPAWLPVPASGYGGTESVIHNLCRGLDEAGVHVELFTIKGSATPASRYHWTYQDEQYHHVGDSMYDAAAIPAAHLLASIDRIRRSGQFDVIHDHNNLLGPAIFKDQKDLPPVLHTFHGPFSNAERINDGCVDTAPFYTAVAKTEKLYFNGISESQLSEAPVALRRRLVGAIHHGIDPAEHKVYTEKSDYFVNVGRMAAEKGLAIAAKLCGELDAPFRMAGIVAGIGDPAELQQEIEAGDGPRHKNPDFIYYRDKVLPQVKPGQIEFVGSVFGEAKDELIGRAKAFLMPIQWEEPFGVAVIDALVCGTPVVAMRRGSMPEIIEHGVNGFLADTPEEFKHYMQRVDEIDPMACRRSVEERFSYQAMTRKYLAAYRRLVTRHAPSRRPSLLPRSLVNNSDLAFYEKVTQPIQPIVPRVDPE